MAVLLAVLFLSSISNFTMPVAANTGCPASSNAFGTQNWSGSCTVTADTTWGNGTLSIAGSVTVQSGARLTLWNLVFNFAPSSDEQYRFLVDGAKLVVRGGTLTSSTPSLHWRLETTTATATLVDVRGANVSYAGGSTYSSFLLLGGTGHRFQRLTVQSSATGSGTGVAVIDIAGSGVNDVRVENSTFDGTGSVFYVSSSVGGTNLVFANNQVVNFTGGASVALSAVNTQIVGNTINVGSATGISLSGGGPGWPSKNRDNVSGNTITTTGYAIMSTSGQGYDVTWNTILGGHLLFYGSGMRFAYNNVSGTDERVLRTHIVSTSSNSSFDHNTLWNVDLTGDSGFLAMNYGNVKITDNRLFLNCYGPNCMGTEVINVQASQRPIYPGFPTVEVARNRITWMSIGSGGLTIMLDNEYSERVWLHDNTEAVAPGAGMPTSSMQGGGVRDSVYENNTILGPTTFCIYEYIYSDAGNLFDHNRCNRGAHAGIFQTGGNVYRDNAFTNLTGPGIWICPNGPCAGSSTNTTNNAWYNNTFTFAASTPYLTQMSLSNALYNVFLGHGATHWTDGTNSYPIYGDWLFFANAAIRHLAWTDTPDGHRTLSMTTGGLTYTDWESVPSITDGASLAVNGAIDFHGSLSGTTVLGSLNPQGTTSLDVTGTGTTAFTLAGFQAGYSYNVTAKNVGQGTSTSYSISVDATGAGGFNVDFGSSLTHEHINVALGQPLPGYDTIPPAQVTDLSAVQVGTNWATLRWMAPGNNGTQGQASQYDLRYSTTGPLNDSNFGAGIRVPTAPPHPAGTTETVNVTGLQPSTTYWFALRTADAVPNWSPISNDALATTRSLAANPVPPSVATYAATSKGQTSATLNGYLGSLGSAASGSVGFLYGTDPTLTGAMNVTGGALSAPGAFSTAVSGLATGTLYYFRAWASADAFAVGVTLNFTASSPGKSAPRANTHKPVKLSSQTATLSGNVSSLGSATAVNVGFLYGTSPTLSGVTNVTLEIVYAPTAFQFPVAGLLPNTVYYFEAWADGQGFDGGGILNFTTSAFVAPTVAPSVLGVTYTPDAQVLDVIFSQPMNRTSVASAISISPSAVFTLSWVNASHLQVLLGHLLGTDTEYGLLIAPTALSAAGQAMGDPFTFRFVVPAASAGAPQPTLADWFTATWFPWVTLALAAGCVVALLLYRRSRKKVLALRRTARMLARRIEEIRATTTQPIPRPASRPALRPVRVSPGAARKASASGPRVGNP